MVKRINPGKISVAFLLIQQSAGSRFGSKIPQCTLRTNQDFHTNLEFHCLGSSSHHCVLAIGNSRRSITGCKQGKYKQTTHQQSYSPGDGFNLQEALPEAHCPSHSSRGETCTPHERRKGWAGEQKPRSCCKSSSWLAEQNKT